MDPLDRSVHDDATPAASDAPPAVSRGVLWAILAPILAWLALMAVVAVIATPEPGAVAPTGWRLVLLRDGALVSFAIALAAAVVGVILVEARRRRD